jgi:CHAD domain-containing protein
MGLHTDTSQAATDTATDTERSLASLTMGEFAYKLIDEHYQRIVKREQKVLADKNPEHLHQMRVNIRRLRTALNVFAGAIELPKAAHPKRLRSLARVLGQLRDLDVQIATLQNDYQPRLSPSEQDLLTKGLAALQKQRRKAFAATHDALTRSSYQALKTSYKSWLSEPRFQAIAQLPVLMVLPDLLSPLLSTLLLHSGWLVSDHTTTLEATLDSSVTLHDLRKVCKQVRYQAEFFADFYNDAFQTWVDEIKQLQEQLGKVQDGQVLLDLLHQELPSTVEMPELFDIIHQEQKTALNQWDGIRQKYLDPQFRQQLHQLIIAPIDSPTLAPTGSPTEAIAQAALAS